MLKFLLFAAFPLRTIDSKFGKVCVLKLGNFFNKFSFWFLTEPIYLKLGFY